MRVLIPILLATNVAAATDDPAPTAAKTALAAHRAGDEGALRALSAADDPDPWVVADVLCAGGEFDAAEAFAKAAPRKATEKLPAYVASRRARAAEMQVEANRAKRAAAVAAHRGAVTLLQGGDLLAAWDTVRDAPDLGDAGVFPVQLALLRADILQQLQRSDEAERAFTSTARAAEELGWLRIVELSLNRVGLLAYQRAGWDEALAAWQGRLRVLEEIQRGPDGEALYNLGLAQSALGDPAARESFERARAVFVKHGRQADAAGSLQALGNAREGVSDHLGALDAQLRALEIFESLHDVAGIAGTVTSIGNTRESLGDYGMAADCHARALRLYEETEDQVGIATVLNNLGVVRLRLGEYAGAFACWERALRLSEERRDLEGVGSALGNLGTLHGRMGDAKRALECHGKALAIAEGLGNRAGAALSLGNLGGVHQALGDHAKAIAYHERALKLHEERQDRGGIARELNNLASAQADLGRLPQALELRERALEILKDLDEPAHVALTLQGVGAIRYRLGDYPKACETQSNALALAEETGFREIVVYSLCGRAFALLAMGRPSNALADARRAASELAVLVAGLGDEQGAGAREKLRHVFEVGAAAAAVLGDSREASFFLESGRAGGLLEGIAVRGRVVATLPEELRQAEARARNHEATALWEYRRVLGQGGDASASWKDVESARGEVIAAVQRIQREAKAQAALLYPEADPLDTIRAALRPGEALVSYALLEKSALALVVTAGGARIVDLNAKIPEAVEAFQRAVARPDERGVAAPPHERLPFLRDRLAKMLLEPLKLDGKTTRLLISPDGLLAYMPFSAVTDREVVYVPSGTTYRLLLEERGRGGEKVLAIGDPDYSGADKTAASIYAGDEGLEALPGTRAEAQAVGDVVLLGKDATRARFGEALGKEPRWRAVHFACHGSVDPERPVLSSLALTAEGDDDGFLKCLDVYQMRIPADLVVLSACETGKGKIYRAEGVIGFTRAFMFAGAPRVIVSLWKVDDHATRALMEKFYEAWKPGKMGAAAALRAAQEHVRSQEKWKHPYFWAAWQLWGLPE